MLLIDLHRNAISQSLASIRVPFVFERVGGNPTAAKALLARLRQGPTLVRALFSELSTHAGSSLNAPNNANRVLEDAARAIASGALLVGRQLPADFKLVLIPEQSAQNLGLDTVIFLTNKIARDFTTPLLLDAAAMAEFRRALEHPAALLVGGVSMGDAHEPADILPELLTKQKLALTPMDPSLRRLQLVWIRRTAPSEQKAPEPPAPPPRAPPPPPPPAAMSSPPASVLPVAPAVPSPQAQALLDAARHGTPFCQECLQKAAAFA